MTMTTDGDRCLRFSCDGCGETLETDTDNFADAQEARTGAGWSAERERDHWEHFCPECRAAGVS